MNDPPALEESATFVDEDVLHWVAAADVGVESPYSQFGTLVAKVRTAFPFLVRVARERACTDCGAIARECGIHAARQKQVLQIVGHHEAVLGRPLLPAVVTKTDREMPGQGYFELVEQAPDRPDDVPTERAARQWIWETQREKVYRAWAEDVSASRTSDRGATMPQVP